MKIKRSRLEEMIREAITEFVNEADEDKKDNKDKDVEVTSANNDEKKGKDAKEKEPVPAPEKNDKNVDKKKDSGDAEPKQFGNDPSDDELEKDVQDEPDESGDSGEEDEESPIKKELMGQTLSDISYNEKSKVVPGARELVLSFENIQDKLIIIITKSGIVKYYFRGIHNEI